MADLKMSPQGTVALVLHEGIVPGPYRDSKGVWTYGIGHTAEAGTPDPITLPRGMPADLDAELRQVFSVLARDLPRYEAAVNAAVKIPIAQHQFDALVSFHFNTGAIARATLVKTLNTGNLSLAAAQFMNWTKPREVTARRQAERDLFARGIYPTGRASIWQVSRTGSVIWKPIRTLSAAEVLAQVRR